MTGPLYPPSRRTSLGSADLSRLRKLEEEQEHLNNSLMALTTHFAQVWRSSHTWSGHGTYHTLDTDMALTTHFAQA